MVAFIVAIATPATRLHFHFYGHQVAGSQTIHSLRSVASFDFSIIAVGVQLPITFLMCLASSLDRE